MDHERAGALRTKQDADAWILGPPLAARARAGLGLWRAVRVHKVVAAESLPLRLAIDRQAAPREARLHAKRLLELQAARC